MMTNVCFRLLAPLLLGTGALAQVEGSWPIYRGDSALSGLVTDGSLAGTPELAWTFKTEDAITSSPVVGGGKVYFGSGDYKIYALDAATGEERWSFATEDIVEAPGLLLDGTLFIGSSDFFFYALDAETGELRWKVETGDKILGGANWLQLEDGRKVIVVGSYDACLYCFDPKDGKELWKYETDNYVNGTPAVTEDGAVVFGGCDAILHLVSVATGESVAQIPLGSECHVAGSVATSGEQVYFGHYGNEFVSVNMKSGDLTWRYPSRRDAFFSSPSILPDKIVFGGRDRMMHCVDRATGEELWTHRTRRKVDSSPLVAGDRVLYGSGDGYLYLLSLADGEELWRYELGRPILSSPAVVGNMFWIGCNDGSLYAFRTGQ